nr:hypothetical protein [Paenibacillus beijingensis]
MGMEETDKLLSVFLHAVISVDPILGTKSEAVFCHWMTIRNRNNGIDPCGGVGCRNRFASAAASCSQYAARLFGQGTPADLNHSLISLRRYELVRKWHGVISGNSISIVGLVKWHHQNSFA